MEAEARRPLEFYFPERLKPAIKAAEADTGVEEIRLRVGRPIQVLSAHGERFIGGAIFALTDAQNLLAALCSHSLYAHQEELRCGYLTLAGGLRVGLAGRPVTDDHGDLLRLTDICGFNIRIARQRLGCGTELLPLLLRGGRLDSTLVISPPGVGKTTLLRDLARLVSDGCAPALPHKVCIIDERSEIAGSFEGLPSMDVGARTDVLDACPKARGLSMAIRSLSPDVVVTDELATEADMAAALDAAFCGVCIMASAHGHNLRDAQNRPAIRGLLAAGVFANIVTLRRTGNHLKFDVQRRES